MKTLLKIWFAFLLFSSSFLFSQSFQKSILIDIAGNNYDFDLLATETYPGVESFITWINKNDSIYTVFLKRITPTTSENIILSSDEDIKSNPKIALNRYAQGIKIVWQNYADNFYKIIKCDYANNSLGGKIVIQDSLINDPQISLSIHRIVWIADNKLLLKEFYANLGNTITVDSLDCASPDVLMEDAISFTRILYERGDNGNHKIYLAEYNEYRTPHWKYEILASGDNRHPNFGIRDGISFETIDNQISKVKYSAYQNDYFITTDNESCNYQNPDVFCYPIPTGSIQNKTPFFVAFDTDSLESNKEIFIKTFYYDMYDSLINISSMEGNDYKPKVANLLINDTVYVAIVWLNESNSKTDIWMSKKVFSPVYSSVRNEILKDNSFALMQNYPDPFNPLTSIEYYIEEAANIKIEVFDILGNRIITLRDEHESSGMHKVIFNGNNLSSGFYFYQLRAGDFVETKKMLLVK